jgi:PAS domain S-box-containing protein
MTSTWLSAGRDFLAGARVEAKLMRRSILAILLVMSLNVEGGEPRRVLLIHSFGQDFQPFITFAADFRSGMARESRQPVDFFDVALADARFESREEGAFVDYLSALFAGHRLDLVVPMGAPAVGFAQKYRARLFPDTPMLLAAVDQRLVQSSMLTTNDAVIAMRHDPRLLVEAMLKLMPDTTNVVMVFGSSSLERFWADEFMRESQLPTNHVACESFCGFSLEKMKQRAAALRRGSVMLFGDVLIDADGIPQTGDEALENLHAAANAPIFGIHDFQLGHGIVGGPLVPVHELARQSASAAAHILEGESPANFRPPPMGASVPTYDWRELRRWNISEDRLPRGSVTTFREPKNWDRYGNWIIGGISLLIIQGVLIGALIANLARRRKSERSLRETDERMNLAASAAEMCLWELDFATEGVWVAGPLAERIGQKERNTHFTQVFQGIHPDDQGRVATALKKSQEGKGDFESVHRRVLPDGKIMWVSARGRVEFDHAKRPLRMRGISMDVTARKEAEERARESEGKFLMMANSTPVIMWASGLDKLCTFCNQAWLDFIGRPLKEQSGYGWAESLHPEDRAGFMKIYSEAFDAREPFTEEYRVRRHDGRYRWISAHGVPRYDEQQNFLGYIGSCVDVTEKKEAEEQAQESEGRFLVMANSTPVIMWATGPDGLGTFCNQAWLDLTGRPLEQQLGYGWTESVHPEDRAGCIKTCSEAFDARRPFTQEYRVRRHDGQYRWVSDHGVPRYDEQQNFLGYIGSCVDVTEKKQAEEQARESEGKFLVMANSTPVIMWASGRDKSCTFCNQAWLDFTGRPLDKQLGYGWAESLHPEDRARSIKTVSEAFDARQPFTQEYRVRRHDGQYRWISDHGVPRYDGQQNFLGFMGSCVDVTERKEAEAELKHSQVELAHVSRVSILGELAGSLAHELNQPLTAILSNAAAARFLMNGKQRNDEGIRDALRDITDEGQRAGEIIAGMRAMLRKEPGQMVTQDVNVAVREVIEMVHSDLVSRRVTPVLRLDPLLPPVKAHSVQLRQVLLNLVMNACDAMSEVTAEQRQLTIETTRSNGEGVQISVVDNGPGFSEEILQHLFEPFHTTKPKGLGLGLAICRSIIAAHGGRLVAANENGRGATLRLSLPTANL